MKINKDSRLQPVQISEIAPSKTGAEPTPQETSATTDSVDLSGWEDEVASLKERTKSIPAVDEDKVASVRRAIDSGTYAADSKKVARSILKGQLLDDLV